MTERNWYVLNFIPLCAARRQSEAETLVERCNDLSGSSLELFAPTIVKMVETDGHRKPREVPLTYQYVFVRGTLPEVKTLCRMPGGYSLVLDRAGTQPYLTVDDARMQSFQTIARAWSNTLPFYSIEDIDLEDGDKVEIVEGSFPGLTGIYIPRKRSNSGNIILAVDQRLGTILYDVQARYVRVLEFSSRTKRAYDQIEAAVPRLLEAIALQCVGTPLPTSLISSLSIFARRMEVVKIPNHKLDAKLQAMLVAANHLLGHQDAETAALDHYRKREKSVTSTHTQALVALLLWSAGQRPDGLAAASALLGPGEEGDSQAVRMLRETLGKVANRG